ncbi:DUF3263 domain-containing protein [Aestuariimicrobium soli]|uniref:DUF3263 domain-containing protein n=1 Tax=Aestuariimicrobium soli TaxID=2035834 RepID=UPI003EBD1105
MSAAAHESSSAVEASALSARDREILDFEDSWWAAPQGKEAEIMERFSVSSAVYHQILNRLLDDPAALAHKPLLVKRLRRLRSARREHRSAGRLRTGR